MTGKSLRIGLALVLLVTAVGALLAQAPPLQVTYYYLPG